MKQATSATAQTTTKLQGLKKSANSQHQTSVEHQTDIIPLYTQKERTKYHNSIDKKKRKLKKKITSETFAIAKKQFEIEVDKLYWKFFSLETDDIFQAIDLCKVMRNFADREKRSCESTFNDEMISILEESISKGKTLTDEDKIWYDDYQRKEAKKMFQKVKQYNIKLFLTIGNSLKWGAVKIETEIEAANKLAAERLGITLKKAA